MLGESAARAGRGVARSCVLAAAVLATPGVAGPPILPFEEVRSGMRGTGRTVFSGTAVESFDVEILGKLENVAPDRNLILARLSGGPLARTGVLAGMSGSPIFIEDRLVGAVAYTWGFSTEPIAGVTPIEEMLDMQGAEPAAGVRLEGLPFSAVDWRGQFRSADRLSEFLDDREAFLRPVSAQDLPLSLAVSGFGPRGLRWLAPRLERAGFLPVQSGTPAGPVPAVSLEPGSAIGVKLVRGDLDMTATGTLTWIEGDRVIAFGHPLFGLGSIDLPLSAVRVETLLPSLYRSTRIATPIADVGAARQDRTAGVAGVIGANPRMIPVRLTLDREGIEHRYSFEIADDPLLSPLLLYLSLSGILAGKERVEGSATIRMTEGSAIHLLHNDDVALDNVYAGPEAFAYGTGIAAYVLHLLMNNAWMRPEVVGIELQLVYEESPRTARIRSVSLDRYRVAPGEAVEVAVVVSPYRGPERIVRRAFVVPPETPPGPLTVAVGAAGAVAREARREESIQPRDLEQFIRLVNRLRRNDRLYIVARRADRGILLRGARLPNLPPSVATLLTRPRSHGNYEYVPRRSVAEETVVTDHVLVGSARIQLEVDSP